MRRRALCGLAIAFFVSATGSNVYCDQASQNRADEQSVDARALVLDVGKSYLAASRGVVGVRSQSVLQIKAPFFSRRTAATGWFIFDGGKLVKSSAPEDSRKPPLRDPYRLDYVGDYTYAFAPCTDCGSEQIAIAFSSSLRDDEHAFGTLIIDRTTKTVISEKETPYRLPWPTKEGSLTATWGDTGLGSLPVAIIGDFVGSVAGFTGRAHYAQQLTSYERFETVDAAYRALNDGSR